MISTVMVGVGYCLHKGWVLREVISDTYKKLYSLMNISLVNNDLYTKKNDFEMFKTNMNSDESECEDDMDNIDLDIHLNLVKLGNDYLKVFETKKQSRVSQK